MQFSSPGMSSRVSIFSLVDHVLDHLTAGIVPQNNGLHILFSCKWFLFVFVWGGGIICGSWLPGISCILSKLCWTLPDMDKSPNQVQLHCDFFTCVCVFVTTVLYSIIDRIIHIWAAFHLVVLHDEKHTYIYACLTVLE